MLTLLLGAGGAAVTVLLVRAGRRAPATERVRRLTVRRRWRLPARPRDWALRALRDADLELEPEAACELWLGGAAAAAVVAAGVAGGLALPTAVATLAAGPIGLRVARDRAQRRFVAALPDALEQVAAALRGGASTAEALHALASTDGPMAADLRRVQARAALGLGLSDALAAWPADRPFTSVRAVAGALALATNIGGRAAAALDGLAASLRERLSAVAEARALSAQARLSAVVVGACPAAYPAFSAVVDPASIRVLVDTAAGRVCLALGLALDAAAVAWMRHLVRDDEPR